MARAALGELLARAHLGELVARAEGLQSSVFGIKELQNEVSNLGAYQRLCVSCVRVCVCACVCACVCVCVCVCMCVYG